MTMLDMPFGAAVLADGGVRFRFWAPGQEDVRLVLPERDVKRAMEAGPDGWFELVVNDATAGDRYLLELTDGTQVADPASRGQAEGVTGPSLVVDPRSYTWCHAGWRGRHWAEAVIHELHVGTFTEAGTYTAATQRLGHLAELGVTAVELMPLADFPGRRNWGYDGVLPYAPARAYGTPTS